MANANALAAKFGMPFLCFAYAVFLLAEQALFDFGGHKQFLEAHLDNLQLRESTPSALILGGSNAYYSLSASLLGDWLNAPAYNLALPVEGYGDAPYNDLIARVANDYLERQEVELVVYSSVLPLRERSIGLYRAVSLGEKNAWGGSPLRLKPQRSVLSYLESFLEKERQKYPLPTASGDWRFEDFECAFDPASAEISLEDPQTVAEYFAAKARFLGGEFPDAAIVMVMPSEFYNGDGLPTAWTTAVHRLWAHEDVGGARLIFQPPIPSLDMVCDDQNHTNEAGRVWRTRDLVSHLDRAIG